MFDRSIADNANFLFELRLAAQHCPSAPHAAALRAAADGLYTSIQLLADDPTPERMRSVNVAWSRALRAWHATPPLGGHDDRAGALNEGAKLAA